MGQKRKRPVEWATLGLIIACYGVWALGTTVLAVWSLPLAILVTGLAIGFFSSLQHEVIHGHPTRWDLVNQALSFPALTLVIPFQRYRDTHLAHHKDATLTDPFDDPESNYLDGGLWDRLNTLTQATLRFNNTLVGRLTVGVIVGQVHFMASEWRALRAGDRRVIEGWLWHIPALGLVALWIGAVGHMPVWAYLAAAYLGLALMKIRTFLEHQAHEKARGRTVIVEDRGPLAFLFLNNNLHVVHHMHPTVPWYALPRLYAENRDRYLMRNDGYRYGSYGEVFRRYMFRSKDPVAHPLWRRG